MPRRRNNGPRFNGNNGHPENNELLKLVGILVQGQAKLVQAVSGLRREMKETRRELVQLRRDHDRGFRMLFKVAMDSHREIHELKVRMTRVERRLDGPPRPGVN